ncbi:MAG TPA: nitrate/sulfonate/bicarbonate ABC transporter ATP-binding protein [Candidatus Cybelea sp.]|nr:nitrate/sulfonate/bicarbonate ABC transporter ATP-binding protein [Candidatus Cybelea sp.]
MSVTAGESGQGAASGGNGAALLATHGVRKSYPKADGDQLLVLDDVNLSVRPHEIVGLLGRSGSGKSTLLRIISGLEPQSGGAVEFQGRPVQGPVPGIAMVFQTFALFPWLTVLENVELGLSALGVPRAERQKKALAAIDLVGLDGYESAFPKELSGGMRQRVGFARALVVSPTLLLMDEPFSALDVLTAETLRTDFIDLWTEGRAATNAVVIVTHNIEEAVAFCDRVLVFSNNPGRIAAEIPIPLRHPRDRQSAPFQDLVERIYTTLTERRRVPGGPKSPAGIGERLPRVSANKISGLMEALANPEFKGRADLPDLARDLQLDVDELFPILEALELLGFAQTKDGDVALTQAGHAYVDAGLLRRKVIFAEQLRRCVPLANRIIRVLEERRQHRAPKSRFLEELEDYLPTEEAERVLDAIIAWGRFAELFSFDMNSGELSLENPGAEEH